MFLLAIQLAAAVPARPVPAGELLGDVSVSGVTSVWFADKWVPVNGADVNGFRNGGPVLKSPVPSSTGADGGTTADGVYALVVPAGGPFIVYGTYTPSNSTDHYYGASDPLTDGAGDAQTVPLKLQTTEQYRKSLKPAEFRKLLEGILKHLPPKHPDAARLRGYLKEAKKE